MNIGGTNYTDIGSSSSPLLLRSNGTIRILWGNKLIDLIKNGKVCSNSSDILKYSDDISGTGIFVTSDGRVIVSINDVQIDLTNKDGYVSYLTELSLDKEQKDLVLTNIGLVADSIDNINITNGFVFADSKLYIVKDGSATEYTIDNNIDITELNIGTLHIYSFENLSLLDSTDPIILQINGDNYITINESLVKFDKSILVGDYVYIQSKGANENSGFRLYKTKDKSILEVDSITWRNFYEDVELEQTSLKTKDYISPISNMIINTSVSEETEATEYTLKYTNEFVEGLKVVILPITKTSESTETYSKIEPVENIITGINETKISLETEIELETAIIYAVDQDLLFTIDKDITLTEPSNDNYMTLKVGEVSEELLHKEDKTTKTGLYCYKSLFEKSSLSNVEFITEYPKYRDDLIIPENNFDNDEYNNVVPNINWIKLLLLTAIPSGTIVMWSGTTIPDGWAICNGQNGTPNLIGRFIKAASTVGEISSDLNENNELTIKLENLPIHSHPHESHTHTAENSGELTTSFKWSDYAWNLSTTTTKVETSDDGTSITYVSSSKTQSGSTTGGDHTHTINEATSTEKTLTSSDYPNKPIKIEPRAYALIFIMKL